METVKVAKAYFVLGLISLLVAVAFTSPIVLFPLIAPDVAIASGAGSILTNDEYPWPAMWMMIGYIIFLVGAAAGSFVWSFAYYLTAKVFNKERTYGWLAVPHTLLFIVGVYGATAIMGYLGFYEGGLIASGVAPLVATFAFLWVVVPTGVMITLALLGVLLGVINIGLTLRMKQQT